MCKTRHIQKVVSRSAVDSYLDTFLAESNFETALKKLQELKDRVQRMRERGGLVVVTTPENSALLTTYALNSYRRR